MKMNYFSSNAVLIMAALPLFFMFSSCSPVEPAVDDPILELQSADSMYVPASRCDTVINYSLINPASGEITVSTEESVWIKGFDVETEGVIAFSVLENTSEDSREGEVVIAYPGAEDLVVTIIQDGAEKNEPVVSEHFTISDINPTAVSVTAHVKPADSEMRYIALSRPKALVDELGDDESLYRYDLEYFNDYSKAYGISLSEVLMRFGSVGEKDIQVVGLEEGQEYYFYVYGTDIYGERLTDICKACFMTDVIELIDVTFTFDIQCEGFVAHAKIKASDPEIPFYFDLTEGYDFRSKEPDEFVSDFIADIFAEYASFGFSPEYVIEKLGSFDEDTYDFGNLQPETEYVVFAAALDYEGMVVSKAGYEAFWTGKPGDASKLTVSYKISRITSRGAYVETYPSDNTVKYFYDVVPAGTDADYVKQIIKNTADSYIEAGQASDFNDFMANLLALRGNDAYEYNTLESDTEYVLYSFGITEDGDYATDIMFGDTFTTLEEKLSDAAIEVTFDKYFDSQEVNAQYPSIPGVPGMALVPSIITVNESAEGYYYLASHGDITDIQTYPDDIILGELLEMGESQPSPYWLSYGEFTYLGVAYDKEGNFGPIFRAKHTITEDGVSPVSDFDPGIMSAGASVKPYSADLENEAVTVTINRKIEKTDIGQASKGTSI